MFGGANIHTLLEPQIKGSAPGPPLNGSFVRTEACEEVGPRRRGGAGKGAQGKDTCHPEKPADDGVQSGARWGMRPARRRKWPVGILRKHGPVCGVSGRDNSGWAPRSGLRLPWVRVIRAKAVWSPRVAGTCPWAQRQRKPKWHGLEEAASVVGDGIISFQVARLLRHSCLQLTFLKSPLCARPRVVRGGYQHDQLGAGRAGCSAVPSPPGARGTPGACAALDALSISHTLSHLSPGLL